MRFPGEISVRTCEYQNLGHARDELQKCYRWKRTNWGVIDQNLLLPTAPCSQLCTALTVCTWADVVIWIRLQTSCISCKTCHLHLQVPQHLKILSSTHKYESRDSKHVFLPPFISSNETEFTARPQPAVWEPVPCRPALPCVIHALVSEDQTHFCNSNWAYCQPK